MDPNELNAAKADLEHVADHNQSTAEQGIDQKDGSVLVLRSVQGDPCEEFTFSVEDREVNGWPATPKDG
jgi:hypothetical protein